MTSHYGATTCLTQLSGEPECALFGRCRRATYLGAAGCVGDDGRQDAYPLRCVSSPGCEQEDRCLRAPDNRCVRRDDVISPPAAKPEAPPARVPAELPPSSMTATLDGRPVLLTHAVAWTTGGRALQVVLADHALDCTDVTGEARQDRRAGSTIELQLAPLLLERHRAGVPSQWRRPAADTWRVTRARWPGGVGADLNAPVTVEQALQRAGDGRLVLDTTLRFAPGAGSTLTLAGTMSVRGCGDRPQPGRTLEHAPRVTLDGESIPIRGATFRRNLDGPGSWLLTLGDAPARCRGDESDVQVLVRAFAPGGKPERPRWLGVGVAGRRLGTEVLAQRRFPSQLPANPARGEDQTVTLEVNLPAEDDDRAPLHLGIAGTVQAVDCDAR
ncbi:MAG: hypothetical protein HY904_08415 [Deltaproteobacteria bacterium]|nr:hypothetical protein [Deltaproteobacteria bacterium]